MPPRQIVAVAVIALLTSALAGQSLPPQLAAVRASAPLDPTFSSAIITPTSLKDGLLRIKIKGHDYSYATLSATCPKGVWLKLGSSDLCQSVRRRTDDSLEHQLLRLRNPNRATGTIAITATIVDPVVATSTKTQKVLNLKLLGK